MNCNITENQNCGIAKIKNCDITEKWLNTKITDLRTQTINEQLNVNFNKALLIKFLD